MSISIQFVAALLMLANASTSQPATPAAEPPAEPEINFDIISREVVQTLPDNAERDTTRSMVGFAAIPASRPRAVTNFSACDNQFKPCIRVLGKPGDIFWIIPKDTFDSWKLSQSRRGASIEEQIDAASSFAFRNWETESVGIQGYSIPSLGEVDIAYLIVPKCYDRSPSGNFRYEHKREMTLRGNGEYRHRLRCSWQSDD